jgi:hypothetical protein
LMAPKKKAAATGKKEGFEGAPYFSNSSPDDHGLESSPGPISTDAWRTFGTIVGGTRPPQPVPLPEGEMLLLATTPFRPDCCPNTYSNSQGCACMTDAQSNWLKERGSNNVPYRESEY